MRRIWARFLPGARIRVRIVAAIVLAMSVVLLAAGGFVYWRVSYALDRQLNQDLRAYTAVVTKVVRAGGQLPADNPGEVSQTYATNGKLTGKSDQGVLTLLTRDQIANASPSPRRLDLGHTLVPSNHPYRVLYFTVETSHRTVVVATAISRHKHDEALRELLIQLAIADLATILAAGIVGWGATNAALGPVERYRQAAAAAGGDPRRRLPVETGRDDELTRLGATFNALLAEIETGHARERQFLADASHELRSPLALMAAEVEWARHRPRTAIELERVLGSIGGQTERMIALANALLDLEEINTALADAPRVSLSLDEILESALAQPRAVALDVGREIIVHYPSELVRVDRAWVELAIANLAFNALKHGSGTITVTANVDGPIQYVSILDEGGGIPPSLGIRAFDRFTRGDPSRSTPGNGLGLALVRAVAARHNGSVRIVNGGIQIQLLLE